MLPSFDPLRFRQALGNFATGVTIVTAVDTIGKDVGLTANSFNSVSLDPPLVLWSIGKTSSVFDEFIAARHFAIHILASDQVELASRFSQKGIDRFAGIAPQRGASGVPLLDGCVARFECRTVHRYEGGDHIILVGEVLNYDQLPLEPLVYKRGRYALAVEKSPTD